MCRESIFFWWLIVVLALRQGTPCQSHVHCGVTYWTRKCNSPKIDDFNHPVPAVAGAQMHRTNDLDFHAKSGLRCGGRHSAVLPAPSQMQLSGCNAVSRAVQFWQCHSLANWCHVVNIAIHKWYHKLHMSFNGCWWLIMVNGNVLIVEQARLYHMPTNSCGRSAIRSSSSKNYYTVSHWRMSWESTDLISMLAAS